MTDREWAWFVLGSAKAWLIATVFVYVHDRAVATTMGFLTMALIEFACGCLLLRQTTPADTGET